MLFHKLSCCRLSILGFHIPFTHRAYSFWTLLNVANILGNVWDRSWFGIGHVNKVKLTEQYIGKGMTIRNTGARYSRSLVQVKEIRDGKHGRAFRIKQEMKREEVMEHLVEWAPPVWRPTPVRLQPRHLLRVSRLLVWGFCCPVNKSNNAWNNIHPSIIYSILFVLWGRELTRTDCMSLDCGRKPECS